MMCRDLEVEPPNIAELRVLFRSNSVVASILCNWRQKRNQHTYASTDTGFLTPWTGSCNIGLRLSMRPARAVNLVWEETLNQAISRAMPAQVAPAGGPAYLSPDNKCRPGRGHVEQIKTITTTHSVRSERERENRPKWEREALRSILNWCQSWSCVVANGKLCIGPTNMSLRLG